MQVHALRNIVNDGRAHITSLLKWFRGLAAENSKDALPLPLTLTDKQHVNTILHAKHSCGHVVSPDWFTNLGVQSFFAAGDDGAATAAEAPTASCRAYDDSACSSCLSASRSLVSKLNAIESSWSALLRRDTASCRFPVIVRMRLPDAAAVALHGDFSRKWSLASGGSASDSIVLAFASQSAVASPWTCSVVRVATLRPQDKRKRAVASPANVEVAVFPLTGDISGVPMITFYGHVRVRPYVYGTGMFAHSCGFNVSRSRAGRRHCKVRQRASARDWRDCHRRRRRKQDTTVLL